MYTFHKSRQKAESGGKRQVSLGGFRRESAPLLSQMSALQAAGEGDRA